jgi:3-oxoacyl-[acyl-carrier-protein] synthase II
MNKNRSNDRRVVITGIGPISSIGIGRDNFWQGILEKRVNIKLEKALLDNELLGQFYTHKIDNFDISKFGIDKDKLKDIREWKEGEEVIDLNYLIAAIKLALDDSHIDYHVENNNIGLVLAHENLGLMPFCYKLGNLSYDMLIGKTRKEMTRKNFVEKAYPTFLKSAYDVQSFADLFHIARVFNVSDYSLFINNACASGLYAFEAAAQIIRNKHAEAVVVAASDSPDILKYLWFKNLGIYSPDGLVRPFCKDSNGLVFGDGGVGIVVEDYEHAKERNASIYAEYLGGGFDLEGWKITVPQIGSNSYQKAMQKTFEHSQTAKEEIDLLCPHGVGYQVIDYYESQAITAIFGNNPKKPAITAFKPYIGHNLGASAITETAILLLALKNNIIPPTLNYNNPDTKFNLNLIKEKKSMKLTTAMKICSAFAGFNAGAIFRSLN